MPMTLWKAAILMAIGLCSSAPTAAQGKHSFEISGPNFLLDGKPFQILAGEMHYSRIPEPYWRHRLKMAKAMGLNSVAVYIFWNWHEPEKGHFRFKDDADVAKFVRLAQEEGLWVLLRPGPYCCAEWEFGGFPYWLLTEPDCVVRSNNDVFLKYAARYMKELGKHLAPLQVTRGGPIVMVQVENEYGSYGSDKDYLAKVRDLIKEAGFEVPLFNADGPSQLPNAFLPDVFPGVNGPGAIDAKRTIDKFRPGGPYLVPEFYPGWLCHWGEKFPRSSAQGVAAAWEGYLANSVSVNIYMFHGGTNFGFWNGANFGGTYQPHITSYDYDAPLDEAGHATEKYVLMRQVSLKRLPPNSVPDIPDAIDVIRIPPIEMSLRGTLLGSLPKPVKSQRPLPMEKLGQGLGFILYRAQVKGPLNSKLALKDLRDYAVVMVDGERVATLDRRRRESACDLRLSQGRHTLDILVENGGRINFGGEIPHNLKGITQTVTLGEKELTGWEIFALPLADPAKFRFNGMLQNAPTLYKGSFALDSVGDTWLDMRLWSKGVVWVNGRNLGRYWSIGPQQTLYLPGCWLRKGNNDIVVLELLETKSATVEGLNHPILDNPRAEPPLHPARPKLAKEPQPTETQLLASGDFAPGNAEQRIECAAVSVRFICLESLTSQGGDPFASCAELNLICPSGKKLDRSKWKVIYTDSEELYAEDGCADNVLDGDPETIWHTEWGAAKPPHPHRIVIDLGETVQFSSILYLPRQGGTRPGMIRSFKLYVSETGF